MVESKSLVDAELAACNSAAKRLRTDSYLINTPEFEFFRDYLRSLGWNRELPPAPPEDDVKESEQATVIANGNGSANGQSTAVDLDAAEPAVDNGKSASGAMALSDSEDEDLRRPEENPFGVDFDSQLRKEHNVSIDEEDDRERLPREADAYPALPTELEPTVTSAAMRKVINKAKQEAQTALEQGNMQKSMDFYTKALKTGGANAQLLCTRATLLLKLKRPLAAVRDCSLALKVNSNLGKAHRIRGICHRKLGHWRRSHIDLTQAQKLEFDEDTARIHRLVARRLGLVKDPKTGQWTKQQSGKKVVAPTLGGVEGMHKGTKVQVFGLQSKPELNGLMGLVEDHDEPSGRFQVRLEGSTAPQKFKIANLHIRSDSLEDQLAARRLRAEEQRVARRKAVEKRLKQDGIPDMDPSELVEAEMSGMGLEQSLIKMVNRLEPDEALELLWQIQATRSNDKQGLLRDRVAALLGEKEEEDESLDDEHDSERLEEETLPPPFLPEDLEAEPANEQAVQKITKAKEAAARCLESQDLEACLRHYTEAIQLGGCSALLLSKRAELLLRLKRPKAAIRDCTAALEVNPDAGKAFRIRGMAHRRLGHWSEAHSDLAQGQTLDFDDSITAVQALVAKRVKSLKDRESNDRQAKRARKS